jgi:hypothetical membrane protein
MMSNDVRGQARRAGQRQGAGNDRGAGNDGGPGSDRGPGSDGPPLPPFPATMNRLIVLGAALWTLSVLFFVSQAIGQAASTRPFDMATNLISDLGNTACGADICSPLHTFVNVSFVAVGAMHALGAMATYRAWPLRIRGIVGSCLLVAAGVGLMLAGLAPENVAGTAHAAGAIVGLVSLNVAMIAFGVSMLRGGRAASPRWVAGLAFASGIMGLLGFTFFLAGTGSPGVAERIADYPATAMVVVLGVVLLVAAARGTGDWRTRTH